ncbi:hypothetical protein WJX81_002647 [Elliptochloris bilobata]|uniref:Growth arrest-specific protein 8 domain-containing protein n=1 Tax=Elliptochloris bilobata TaxID=381761 RepID=A0AAW1R0H3_9CHLO
MPPKPQKDGKPTKGGAKAKGKAPPPEPIKEGPSVDELNQRIAALEAEKKREEELRNYMQLERDKIATFWEIGKHDAEDQRAELRNKDRELEELEERHQVEIKVYKQKVKHLLYEHQHALAVLKADGEAAVKQAGDEAAAREADLRRDLRTLHCQLREQEDAHGEAVRGLQLEAAKQVSKLRQEVEAGARGLAGRADKRLRMAREEAELRRRTELAEVEERKNTHIQDLTKRHEAAFAEIKAYYNDVTANNLDLVKALKEDAAELRKREAAADKLLAEVAAENRALTEPLAQAQKEVEALRSAVATQGREREVAAQAAARLAAANKQIKALEWSGEVQLQRLEQVQAERDKLAQRVEAAVVGACQAADANGLLAERRADGLQQALTQREAELRAALAAGGPAGAADAKAAGQQCEQLQAEVRDLRAALARASKAHADLLCVYEALLTNGTLPRDQPAFGALRLGSARAPAGLVAGVA